MAATASQINYTQLMYIAYYGRPSDPGGLEFWSGRMAVEGPSGIAAAFGNSPEFQANYGNLSNTDLVNGLYLQLFGRDADPSGLAFYVSGLIRGDFTLPDIALRIIDGVGPTGSDAQIVENRLEVANHATALQAPETNLSDDVRDAVLDTVTADPATVSAAIEELNNSVEGGIVDGNATPVPAANNHIEIQEDLLRFFSGQVFVNDPEGDTLTFTPVGASDGIEVFAMFPNGSFDLKATDDRFESLKAGEETTAQFTYDVSDGVSSTQQTVTFTIVGENDAPLPAPHFFELGEAETQHYTGQLSVVDPDGDALTFTPISASDGIEIVSMRPDGSFDLRATDDRFSNLFLFEETTAQFTYEVSDGIDTVSQTVFLQIEGEGNPGPPILILESVREGASPNVLLLDIEVQAQARGGLELFFLDLPEGAQVAIGDDTFTRNTFLSSGRYTATVTLDENTEASAFSLMLLEVADMHVNSVSIPIGVGSTSSSSQQNLSIDSEDQSLWDSGDAAISEWSSYYPIIGGDRAYFDILAVSVIQGQGRARIDGEKIAWDPEGAYDNLSNGAESEILIRVTYRNQDTGEQGSAIHTITAVGSSAGTGYIAETGEVFSDEVDLIALPADVILDDPVYFGEGKLIDIEFDAVEDVVRPAVDSAFDALRRGEDDLDQLRQELLAAVADRQLLEFKFELTADTVAKLRAFQAADFLANTAGDGLQEVRALEREVADLDLEVAAKEAAKFGAELAVNAAREAVNTANGALSAASSALSAAQSAVNTALNVVSDATAAFNSALSDFNAAAPFNFFLRPALDVAEVALAEARSTLTARENDRNSKQGIFNIAQNALNSAQNDLNAAHAILDDAEADLKLAIDRAVDKADELLTATAGRAIDELEYEVYELEEAREFALEAYIDAEDRLWENGFFVGQSVDEGDIATVAGEVAEAGLKETGIAAEITAIEIEVATLEGLYDLALEALDSGDLIVNAEFSAEGYAQAGLQLRASFDGGSVDSTLDYALTTDSTYNASTDTLTLAPTLTDLVTGDSVAFRTESPNVSFFAGIAYSAGVETEGFLEVLVRLFGETLVDVSEDDLRDVLTHSLSVSGWLPLIDVSSADFDGGELDLNLPGAVGDVLSIELNVPSIETEGTAAVPNVGVYQEGALAVTNAVFEQATQKIEFSPEFQALLIEKGVTVNQVFNDGFGSALATALEIVLASATGEGDTDGDGVVPIFILDTSAGQSNDALLHLNTIADDISGVDETPGDFGFFIGSGQSENIVQVTVDIDQIIAIAVNSAFGNSPATAINPLDLSFELDDVLELTPLSQETQENIKDYINFGISAELADFDVSAGIRIAQDFVLSVDDVEFTFLFEDGSQQSFLADEEDHIIVENASLIDENGNGDGDIDYELIIAPKAEFFNDTEIALSLGYTLDLIKASFNLEATLPFDLDLGLDLPLPFPIELPTELDLIDLAIGPLLRVEGEVNALSADIFEDRFEFDAGEVVVVGSVDLPVEVIV